MIIEIHTNEISAQINTKGAELFQLNSENKNYIWEINEAHWNKTSPILFPIVGQLKNDSYNFEGSKYKLNRHGFARDFEFKIVTQQPSSVEFKLNHNEETLKLYPFEFELTLKYSIKNYTLTKEYSVKNLSQTKMPFSIGAHPAFAINLDKNKFSIEFDCDHQLESHQLENGLFSGKTKSIALENSVLNLDYSLFNIDALVFKNLKSRKITVLKNNSPFLKLDLGNFPDLGIWTKTGAPFLCLEPWHGYADDITSNGNILEKEGIQILKPQQTFTAHYTIEILYG